MEKQTVANVEDQVEETTGDAEKDAQVDVIGSSAQEVANQNEHPDSSEMRNIDLESKVKLLEGELKDLEEECDCQRNTIAVNDMLYGSFKERMRDKNMYDSDDTESDYEPDDEQRERSI